MVTIDLWQMVIVIIAVFGSVAGLLKYVFYLLERHKEYMDSRFDEHKTKLSEHNGAIQTNTNMIHEIREELYSSYVKSERLDTDFTEIMKKFDQVFGFLTGLSRDVNQLIGKDAAKSKEGKK